ncbi:ABC transporter ATP-binding protein [Hoeflea olei]|uniref:Sugar ABC transporter ATP-binding protein n=1 Tax=Hoeflea olei TaxID=1480615 RepID=A0A1C1YUM4_9HYPH|nr:sn-glycerol-3-phosphate ABC transporter ATP-binding protein UgpC [Hoeflea olei]OCW57050.1 sugar ABC transporter ATP-binding protein [Hoeflea olei]
MPGVILKDVRKSFGKHETIHGVSVEIGDGEFVTLVGPSGCGKSTVLRMIAGLETVTAGSISINGKEVNGIAPKDRDIAMVFQSYALYPHMTVAENMGFSLKMRGLPKAEIDAAVKKTAGILGLEPYLARYPKALSGGQRQRVAMGRAIVRNPAVFLFDEPLSNLDAKLRVQMRTEIKDLHHRLKTTTVYVTHDQIEAMTMAEKIVVLNDGRIEQVGTPLELYDTPVNRFVAGFIGSPSMNFLPCRRDDAGGLTSPTGQKLTDTAPEGPKDQPLILGIRPENITLQPGGIPCEVKLVEPTGAETMLSLELSGVAVTAVMKARVKARPGETIHIGFEPDSWHVFDEDSGLRIPTAGS